MSTETLTSDDLQQTKYELGDYPEFYSHLAIQSRRASRVALVACGVALIAIVSAILAQLRPPVLLRVQEGNVSALTGSGVTVAETTGQQQPDESEKLAFVSAFLDRFVNIDPVTVKRNTTLALNEMTTTLPADPRPTERAALCGHRARQQCHGDLGRQVGRRSEEHTSELQSRFDLVCR